MKRPVRPRALVHRGAVECVGVVVSASSSDGGRRRVLSLWAPGVTAFRLADAWLVRWTAPRRLRAEQAPGDVLVATNTTAGVLLASAPLDAGEIVAVIEAGARAGDVVRVRGAEAIAERTGQSDAVDPALWLDVGPVAPLAVRSLGAPLTPLKVVDEGAPPRAILVGAVKQSSGALARAISAAMESLSAGGAAALDGSGAGGEGVGEAGAARRRSRRLAAMRESLLRALLTITQWFSRRRRVEVDRDESPAVVDAPPERELEPPSPGVLAKWFKRLEEWISQSLRKTRVAEAFGARYARYLTDMVDAFERGDLTEALRMAVPLGDGSAGSAESSTSWSLPTPRDGLEIRVGAKASGPGFTTSLYDRIRALYRATAERLEAEGRIEEAAFVHAELLGDLAGAVSLLERHRRFTRAAELAEAAKLAPELVVRQWMLADDLARAVLFARRMRCFDVAVTRLESSDRALATALRREWALVTAASGDLARAVEIAWPVTELREMTAQWVDAAVALGGVGGAKMLARKLSIRPESLADVLSTLREQADDATHDGARARVAFAHALLQQPIVPEAQIAARTVARTIISDGAKGATLQAHALVVKLVDHARDGSLRNDLPQWVEAARVPLSALATAKTFDLDGVDVGTRRVFDAAPLADGRIVVAMGEAGVWIVARDGRVVSRLDAPSHSLVMSDHGDRCLALGRRGKGYRVSRVDLLRRSAGVWGEAEIDAFAPTFDGDNWVVGVAREVFVVDALSPRIEVLRPMISAEAEHKVSAFSRTPKSLAFRSEGQRPEVWTYDVTNGWILRGSHPASASGTDSLAAFDSDAARLFVTRGERWGLSLHAPTARPLAIDLGNARGPIALLASAMSAQWIAVASRESRGVEVTLFHRVAMQVRWRAKLAGASLVSMRLDDERLVLCDDVGRVLGLDLSFGDVAFDLRL